MASENQGEVIINIDVDSEGFDKGTNSVEKAIKSLENTMNKAVESMSKSISETLTAALKNFDSQIEQTGQTVKDTASKSRSGSSSSKGRYTEEYKELSDFVEQQEKNLAKLEEQQKRYDEMGLSKDKQYAYKGFTQKDNPLGEPSEYKTLQQQINDYAWAVKNAKEEMQELEASGKKFALSLSQEFEKIASEVSELDFTPLDVSKYSDSVKQYAVNVNKANLEYAKQQNTLAQLQAQLEFLREQEQTPEVENKITELENKIQELTVKLQQLGLNAQSAENAFNNAVDGSKAGLSNIVGYFKKLELFPPTVKKIGSGVLQVAKGFKKVGSAISKAASHLNIFNRGQGKSADMSKKLVNQFTRIFTMVKSRIVRSFVSSLFSGITDGIKELSKADDTFNKRISELKSKFSQLKFAIMSAFAPLISYAVPAITKAMTYINSLVDKIGQLTAALTGQNTYQKARYNFTDYAKSLDDTKKSTDKTKKSTDKLTDSARELNKQLASFDELNVLNFDKDEDDEDETEIEAEQPVYVETEVGLDMSNLSQRIKEAFASGDFTELGEELGNKLNEQIRKIDPTKIGETIARIINSASSFAIGFLNTVEWGELTRKITSNLNALIENVDTNQLGEAFAAIINTVFEIGFTFADTFNWEEFGSKIADFVNSVFENTDWEKVGKTINSFIIGILDMILSFVDKLNGDEIGNDVGKMIGEIDIAGIAVRLAKILWGVMKLTWKIITGLWNGSGLLEWWEEQGEKWGKGISDKFIVPFKDLVKDIKKAIEDGNWKQYFYDVFLAPIDIILNAIIDLINGIGFDIPDFVPVWGGTHVGFDIPHIPMPKLATGTVVPANYGEFAAILGDNKREPEVVSPLSTMKQAMLEALIEAGVTSRNNDGDIVVQIGSREIFRVVKEEADNYKRTHGGRPAFG